MGIINHNTEDHQARNADFEPLPDGRYLAQMVDSEVKATSRGDGMILKATFEILEPGFEDRKVFTNFNIQNPNEKAEQIGRGMLSSLCKACGKTGLVEDSEDLHEIPVVIRVKVEPAQGEYGPKNVVTGFYEKEGKIKEKKAAKKVSAEDDEDTDIPF